MGLHIHTYTLCKRGRGGPWTGLLEEEEEEGSLSDRINC